MELILQPLKLNKAQKAESTKTAKYIHIGKEKIPIGNVRLDEVFKTYLLIMREEITQKKVQDFIDNF